ncbi:MAG: LysR family transcriptional regulator [Gammaproteobacteria bacterium]|nr:LysR family transcriptional regulator [Gammaproteobacteria bacterium]
MRFGHFDLNLLLALDALLDTGSVTRASQRLRLGQSATSSALGRLREQFGDALLVKVGRRMEMTPLAQDLRKQVRETLLRLESLVEPRRSFDPARAQRRFQVHATDYLVPVLLAPLMRALADQAPGISLSVSHGAEEPAELIERGQLDLLVASDAYLDPRFPSAHLFDDIGMCVADARNEAIGPRPTRADVLACPFVVARLQSRRTTHFQKWLFESPEMQRRIEIITPDFNSVPMFIVGTRRIAVMHASHARWWAQRLPLKIVPSPLPLAPLGIHMQWNARYDADPAHTWLRQRIQALAPAGQLSSEPALARLDRLHRAHGRARRNTGARQRRPGHAQ